MPNTLSQQTPISSNVDKANSRKAFLTSICWINKDHFSSEITLSHHDYRLLLVRRTLQIKISVPDLPGVGDRLNGKQFLDPLSKAVPARKGVDICVRIRRLFFEPTPCPRRILFFQPAIRVCNRYTMQDIGDWLRWSPW